MFLPSTALIKNVADKLWKMRNNEGRLIFPRKPYIDSTQVDKDPLIIELHGQCEPWVRELVQRKDKDLWSASSQFSSSRTRCFGLWWQYYASGKNNSVYSNWPAIRYCVFVVFGVCSNTYNFGRKFCYNFGGQCQTYEICRDRRMQFDEFSGKELDGIDSVYGETFDFLLEQANSTKNIAQ